MTQPMPCSHSGHAPAVPPTLVGSLVMYLRFGCARLITGAFASRVISSRRGPGPYRGRIRVVCLACTSSFVVTLCETGVRLEPGAFSLRAAGCCIQVPPPRLLWENPSGGALASYAWPLHPAAGLALTT